MKGFTAFYERRVVWARRVRYSSLKSTTMTDAAGKSSEHRT
jgi:hypothetical protein